jgi:phospholipase/carboxylesterase
MLRFLPASRQAPKSLIVLLHGVGANAESMEPLASYLHTANPDAAISLPNAPAVFDLGGSGRQWFSIKGVTDQNRTARIAEALPPVEVMIADELRRYGLTHRELCLVGFSQGAMLALAMANSESPPAAIASIAGRVAGPVRRSMGHVLDVFLTHGTADQIVPFECMKYAEDAFSNAGYYPRVLPIAGLDHQISKEQADALAAFCGDAMRSSMAEQTA